MLWLLGVILGYILRAIAGAIFSRVLDRYIKYVEHSPYLRHYFYLHHGRPTKCEDPSCP